MTAILDKGRTISIGLSWRADPTMGNEEQARRYYRDAGAALYCFRASGLAPQAARSTDPADRAGSIAGAALLAEMLEARSWVFCAEVTTTAGATGWWCAGASDYAIYPASRDFAGGDVFLASFEAARAHLGALIGIIQPENVWIPEVFDIPGSERPAPLGELLVDDQPRLRPVRPTLALVRPLAGPVLFAVVLTAAGWGLLKFGPALIAAPPVRQAQPAPPVEAPPPPPEPPPAPQKPPPPRRAAQAFAVAQACLQRILARVEAEDPAAGVTLSCDAGADAGAPAGGLPEAAVADTGAAELVAAFTRGLATLRIKFEDPQAGKPAKPAPGERPWRFSTTLPPEYWLPRLREPWLGGESVALRVDRRPVWTVSGRAYGR